MLLSDTTLEKLRILINEETTYRSGPQLVQFFNKLGGKDQYGQGFPSRWIYTDEKLKKFNGTPELDKCIRMVFDPRLYIGRFQDLDRFINELNQFMVFDKWKVIRNNTEITFKRVEKVQIPDSDTEFILNEDEFLNKEFSAVSLDNLGFDSNITDIINSRLSEIKNCIKGQIHLSAIFLTGSSLEGILLGIALKNPRHFNSAKSSPKKDDKVKPLHEWTLSNLIDTAHELGLLRDDVKKFSHALREFRNYIHPYQQLSTQFFPDQHTAQICWQVLKAAIYQLGTNKIT